MGGHVNDRARDGRRDGPPAQAPASPGRERREDAMKPLDGIGVDAATMAAAPFASASLAGFGVEVAKPETPGEGGALRKMGTMSAAGGSFWWLCDARKALGGTGPRDEAGATGSAGWWRTYGRARWRSGGWGSRACGRRTRGWRCRRFRAGEPASRRRRGRRAIWSRGRTTPGSRRCWATRRRRGGRAVAASRASQSASWWARLSAGAWSRSSMP